jgi:diguanylate cyclase (GGDEF)-like protein
MSRADGSVRAGSRVVSVRAGARVALIAVATTAVVVLAGGGDAFWLCLPGALLAAAWSRTRAGMVASAATVVACAAVPAFASAGPHPRVLLAVVVPAACVGVLGVVRERLRGEVDRLHQFAYTDPLTGAANRRSLLARIDYEVARHTRTSGSFAVLMLDLDGFKRLNDRFGHAAGDEVLRDIAAAISGAIRAQDTVARLGGDEFAVLAPETDVPGARQLAARIGQAIADAAAGLDGLSASSGAALFPDDGRSATSLLDAADQRLLRVKRERDHRRVPVAHRTAA